MKNLRHIVLILFLAPLFAAGQQLSLSVSKQRILLGEPFTVSLKVFAPSGVKVQWLQIDSIPHFEILDRSKIDSLREGNDFIIQQNYTLTSWDSGSMVLPPFQLPGTAQRTKPVRIEVAYTSPWDPNKDYNPVKDIIEVEKPERTTWYWYVALGLLLLLILILIFPRDKKPKPKKKIVVNAYDQAMKELASLEQKTEAPNKEWYTSLVDVLRNYIYYKKDIETHSKTSDELSIVLHKENMGATLESQVLQTLRLSDAVKFARYDASRVQKEESLQTIKKAIQTLEGKG